MHAPVRLGFVARQLLARSHDAPPYDDAFYIPLVKQIVGTLRGSRGGGIAEACDENHGGAPYVDFGQHGVGVFSRSRAMYGALLLDPLERGNS